MQEQLKMVTLGGGPDAGSSTGSGGISQNESKLEKKVSDLTETLKKYKENASLAIKKIKKIQFEKEEATKVEANQDVRSPNPNPNPNLKTNRNPKFAVRRMPI